jgi:glycerol-3-phosphate dehydrogenase (NAD(P)+)
MMGMTADSLASLGAPISVKPARVKADSEDATMMGMTADSLASLGAPISVKPARVKADSDDATMMGMTAASLAALGAPISVKPARVKADHDDATMMGMTADSMAGLFGQRSSTPPGLADVAAADLILLTAPPAAVRGLLREVSSVLSPRQMIVLCVDGFCPPDPQTGEPALLISEVVRQETALTRIGALAGPARPEDLEEWSPAGLVCGSASDDVGAAIRQVLGCTTLRVYTNRDLIGVEVARAMSGMVALASGVCEFLEFGSSARAMLVSRSAAEIARLGVALGGKERTFLGLAGFGGFNLASDYPEGADFQLGRLLGSGLPIATAQQQLGRPTESIAAIPNAYDLASRYSVHTPILTAMERLVFARAPLHAVVRELLEDPNFIE